MAKQYSIAAVAFLCGGVLFSGSAHHSPPAVEGLSPNNNPNSQQATSRRQAIGSVLTGGGVVAAGVFFPVDGGNYGAIASAVDVDSYLKTGGVAMPMGVSGQAGKSKPDTGVLIREGTDVSRDSKSGNVLAEILVQKSSGGGANDLMPVVTTFSSPWPLATGMVYDVECRDAKTGDGAFLAVTPPIESGSLQDVKDSFLIKSLFGPTGRFSFYGQPTDVKVKKSTAAVDDGSYKILDVSFSTLSQATQTELPRYSRIVATVPKGSRQAVMLVGSASAARWKTNKGSQESVTAAVQSFRATAAPESGLKMRPASKS